jgi:hypothetical protein
MAYDFPPERLQELQDVLDDGVLGLLGQEIANLAESVLLEVAKETVASPHAS